MRPRERWSSNRPGCPAPTRAMRVRTLPTVLSHARTRARPFSLTTAQWCHATTTRRCSAQRRWTRRGVAGACVVWDHVVEVRLLPSGRYGDARKRVTSTGNRQVLGSSPSRSTRGPVAQGQSSRPSSGTGSRRTPAARVRQVEHLFRNEEDGVRDLVAARIVRASCGSRPTARPGIPDSMPL